MHRPDAIFAAPQRCSASRIILFDWDGTIVDSIQAVFEANVAICRKIGVPFDESIFRRKFSPNWRLMYRSSAFQRIGRTKPCTSGRRPSGAT